MKVNMGGVIAFTLVGLLVISAAGGILLPGQGICEGDSGDEYAAAASIQFGERISDSSSKVSHVEITPSLTNIRVGEPVKFTAQAYDSYGNEIADLSFSWGTDVGFIDGSGYFRTAVSSGTTGSGATGYVRAFCGSIYGEARIHILPVNDRRQIWENKPGTKSPACMGYG